jgi:hypothetical protein
MGSLTSHNPNRPPRPVTGITLLLIFCHSYFPSQIVLPKMLYRAAHFRDAEGTCQSIPATCWAKEWTCLQHNILQSFPNSLSLYLQEVTEVLTAVSNNTSAFCDVTRWSLVDKSKKPSASYSMKLEEKLSPKHWYLSRKFSNVAHFNRSNKPRIRP